MTESTDFVSSDLRSGSGDLFTIMSWCRQSKVEQGRGCGSGAGPGP